MILKIKAMDLPMGRFLVLTDESGELLPNQTGLTLANGTDQLGTVTVTFAIDGEKVSLAAPTP